MQFKLSFLTFLLCISSFVSAQDFLGYINSNYSGVTGTDLQPATVVDSRYKTDFNLLGASLNFYTNIAGIKHSAIKPVGKHFDFSDTNYPAFKDTAFQKDYMNFNKDSKTKSIFLRFNVYLPSLMVNLNEKNAIAIKWKVRTLVNIDGIEPDLSELMYNQLKTQELWNKEISNKNFSIQEMTWAEYGLTYGHAFKNDGEHFFKVGGTIKLVEGIQAAYLFINDLHYKFTTDTTVGFFHSDVSYGHSKTFDFNPSTLNYRHDSHPALAGDIGVVYEWRPHYQNFIYEMNGQKGLHKIYENKYTLRVGLSLLDIGRVKFEKGPGSRDFTADIGYWNIHHLDPNNIADFDDTLTNVLYDTSKVQTDFTFKMRLPTVLSAQIDYQIWKNFYVNVTPYLAFPFTKSIKNAYYKNAAKDKTFVHELSCISITPRWDVRYLGVFVPVTYDAMRQFKVGLGLRLGPIIITTTNLAPFLSKKDIHGIDVAAMVKFPVLFPKVRDRDKDKVSDDRDRCRDVPGVWEFYGCPDRDGDHVEDKDDQCPDEAGLPEFLGCPDKDGDKVIDKQDACPDVAGLAEFNGCPDTDGDKIIDKEDDCPNEPGLPEFKGCPDRDADGIMDKSDECPDKPGPVSNNGCPEIKLVLVDSAGNDLRTVIQNKEGSFSFDDLPPDEQVRFKLVGDSTEFISDVKVNVGTISKKAIKDNKDGYLHFIILHTDVNKLDSKNAQDVAIKLDTAEQAIVAKAFSNLEFATGKDVILSESNSSLEELAALLKKKTKWRLKISGHTDNQGVAAANMKLSQKRAEAVKKYLVGKGIDATRFKVEWFGSSKPIADNKTEAGRQKNRRVEMLIIK